MASICPSTRCSSPKVTTCSTASKTFSHEVGNDSAVSFQESFRAQRARNSMYARVSVRLAVTPRNLLDDNRLAMPAIDPAHGVQQEDQKAPEGNELEPALGELIVSTPRLMTARTDRFRPFARTDRDLDAPAIGSETGPMINESRKAVTTICSENNYSRTSGTPFCA